MEAALARRCTAGIPWALSERLVTEAAQTLAKPDEAVSFHAIAKLTSLHVRVVSHAAERLRDRGEWPYLLAGPGRPRLAKARPGGPVKCAEFRENWY
jgi:hypothetical protein